MKMKKRYPSTGTRFLTWLVVLAISAASFLWLQNRAASHADPLDHLKRLEEIRNHPEERHRAIGPAAGLSEPLKRAFDPGDGFDVLTSPQPGDWLWQYDEPGQTYQDFQTSRINIPDSTRDTIYLQPLGAFAEAGAPSLEQLRAFAAAYFDMKVTIRQTLDIDRAGITSRANPYSGQQQFLTGDILRMLKVELPADAFCMLAVTMVDLYPEPSWNFVFGQATLQDRVGVFSLARYDPQFYGGKQDEDSATILLRRSCKVLAHETGHMFGIHHCIFFNCLMNGSNSLGESDRQPIHLCPVDLRKLQYGVEFDVRERYLEFEQFYKESGLAREEAWVKQRLRTISESSED